MLAIIGGTGVYHLEGLELLERLETTTPFGTPSAPVMKGVVAGREILFLARHGERHQLLPHEINYRANIFALKACGATQIIGVSAVGSLHEEIAPGELAIPAQYFDWTRGKRSSTFFGNGIAAHVSTAKSVSANLTAWIAACTREQGIRLHTDVTYACVEGPRLGTQAESHFLRQAGCHLVGMTNIPEVFLAREAQICYATIGIVTDYDCWMEDAARHVTASSIFELYRESLKKVRVLLRALLSEERPAEEPEIRKALSHALLTPEASLTEGQRAWLAVLRR